MEINISDERTKKRRTDRRSKKEETNVKYHTPGVDGGRSKCKIDIDTDDKRDSV